MIAQVTASLRFVQWSLVGVILLLGLSLRTYQLDRIPGMNGDETFPTVQMNELVAGRPVTLWVPTQRILSPIYASLVLLTNKISPNTSFWAVRLPAVIAGIAFILMSFFCLRQPVGDRVALFTLLLVTALPMNIAYSRSAVEQCLMGAVGIFCLSQALRGSALGTLLAFVLAVLAHPVNVFLAPMLLWILLASNQNLRRAPAVIGFLIIIIGLLACLPEEYGLLNLQRVSAFLLKEPWEGVRAAWLFFIYFIRLISGATALEYFSMPPLAATIYTLDFLIGSLILTVIGFAFLRLRKDPLVRAVVGGFLLMALCLFYAAGPKALTPGLSRHANVFMAPFAFVMALILAKLSPTPAKLQRTFFLVSAICIGFLAFFYQGYFQTIQATGGGFTHRTYITGPVEPKQAIFKWAIHNKKASRLIAEDWWIYWPLKYLAQDHPGTEVIFLDEKVSQMTFLEMFKSGSIAIGFPGLKAELLLRQTFDSKNIGEFRPESYTSGPALTAFYLKPTQMK